MRTFAFVSLFILAAACGGKSNPPADPVAKPADAPKTDKPADPPAANANGDNELEAKGIAFMIKVGDVFSANADNCDKLATELKTLMTDNKPLLGQLRDMEKTQTKEQKEAFENRHKDEFKGMEGKMMPAFQKCQGNANVTAAVQELMQ
jgi:hypothetical protein